MLDRRLKKAKAGRAKIQGLGCYIADVGEHDEKRGLLGPSRHASKQGEGTAQVLPDLS